MNTINVLMRINYSAVFVALVVHMLIGSIWYHPFIFGGTWKKITGREIRIETKLFPIGVISHLISHIALAAILLISKANTILDALVISLFVSIGFSCTVFAGEYSFRRFTLKQFLIKAGDEIVSYSIAAAILYLWK